MAEFAKKEFGQVMLDPSILVVRDFWEEAQALRDFFPRIYFPRSVVAIKDEEMSDFFMGYLSRRRTIGAKEISRRARDLFQPFERRRFEDRIPEQLRVNFAKLRSQLEVSELPYSVRNVLLEEFVFLSTQSSVLARLKKVFKLFEKLNVFPLLNLEEVAPDEMRETVRGLKKAVDFVN